MKKHLLGLLLFGALAAGGCSLTQDSASTSPSGPAAGTAVAPPPQPAENYYDFNDVAVPQEMNLQLADSFILETPTTRTGVMTFTGRVDANSLRNYYVNTMAKDGWTMRSAITSNKSILLFEKPGKYGIIIITDGTLKTRLEIWVTPQSGTIGDTGYVPARQPSGQGVTLTN